MGSARVLNEATGPQSTNLDGWVVPYGPDGVLDVQKGVVRSAGRATITKRLAGRPVADVLAELRRYGQK